jgi:hypothetical protein
MSRWLGALLGGLIALAVWGQVRRAAAEEPIVLLEEHVLVPADWLVWPQSEAFTRLADGQLMDPFQGREKLADPWFSTMTAAKAPGSDAECDCRCVEVLTPSDWR